MPSMPSFAPSPYEAEIPAFVVRREFITDSDGTAFLAEGEEGVGLWTVEPIEELPPGEDRRLRSLRMEPGETRERLEWRVRSAFAHMASEKAAICAALDRMASSCVVSSAGF